jgi:CelD/BcsL family acetyltransferase involved in cellulose biosynthesis
MPSPAILAASPPAGVRPGASATPSPDAAPVILPATDPGLRAALADHPRQSLFSAPPWIETLALTYGFPIRAVATAEAGGVAALLFAEIDDLRGERLVSLPFSDYCDPLVQEPATWQRLATPLLATGRPWRLRTLRSDLPAGDPRLVRTGGGLWHGLALNRAEAELWAGLGGSARRNVRHAQRCGVTVRAGTSREDVHRFRALHTHLRKTKYRLLPQPAAFFDHLHERFAADDRLVVLLAVQDGTPIAAVLLLVWQDVLYYKFNASCDTEARPNDLLAWHTIRLGRERGLRLLDFGISDLDQPGLVRYKRKFASVEREIAFWGPARAAPPEPRHLEATRTLHALTGLLTDPSVPDAITAAAGDQLYRFFP